MRICENHPLASQPIHVRRRDLAVRVQALHVAVAQVIAQDQQDVRPRRLGGGRDAVKRGDQNRDECEDNATAQHGVFQDGAGSDQLFFGIGR